MDGLKEYINRYRMFENDIATCESNKNELSDTIVEGLCECITSFLERSLDIPKEVVEKVKGTIRTEVCHDIFRWYRLYVRNDGKLE